MLCMESNFFVSTTDSDLLQFLFKNYMVRLDVEFEYYLNLLHELRDLTL
jgi:hypothetical protein